MSNLTENVVRILNDNVNTGSSLTGDNLGKALFFAFGLFVLYLLIVRMFDYLQIRFFNRNTIGMLLGLMIGAFYHTYYKPGGEPIV